MNAVLLVLVLFAAACALLVIVGWLDERLDDRYPSYSQGWAKAFGEPAPGATNVRTVSVVPCRTCDAVGYHHEGCQRVDRFDADEVTR